MWWDGRGFFPTVQPLAPVTIVLAALIATGCGSTHRSSSAGSPAASARSADTVVVDDVGAQQIAALGGTIVWVSGQLGSQSLMIHTPRGDTRVAGTPRAYDYDWIDLGRDSRGRVVLTYVACTRYQRLAGGCTAHLDDLQSHGAPLTGLALAGCQVNTPAVWGTRTAYNLYCETGHGSRRRQDPVRSGLYVKTATGKPQRLVQPTDRANFAAFADYAVDLRANRVAGLAASDAGVFGFSETVTGRELRSFVAAGSLNRPDGRREDAPGLALGPDGALWTLKVTTSPRSPTRVVVSRRAGRCTTSELLTRGPGRNVGPFPGGQLAVDGQLTYLLEQGTGILAHHFKPDHAC